MNAVVFDFDGTLVDSGDIKRQAYRAAIASVLEPAEDDMHRAYHAHGALNRKPQLNAAFRDLAGRAPSDAEHKTMLAAYGATVDRQRPTVVPFDGMLELLADQHRSHFLAVASNAPQDEVADSCAQLGLAAHLDMIFGHPTSKGRAIEAVRKATDLPANAITYVGDRQEDHAVARCAGVRFVRFGPLEPDDGTEILRDVNALASALADAAE